MRTKQRREIARETFSTEEVADALGASPRFVRALISSGDLPSLKLGALRKVRRSDLDAYLAARVEEGRADRL